MEGRSTKWSYLPMALLVLALIGANMQDVGMKAGRVLMFTCLGAAALTFLLPVPVLPRLRQNSDLAERAMVVCARVGIALIFITILSVEVAWRWAPYFLLPALILCLAGAIIFISLRLRSPAVGQHYNGLGKWTIGLLLLAALLMVINWNKLFH